MKKLFVLLLALTSMSSALAYTCRVDLVDVRGRVINTYYAQTDYNGMCRDGLRDCNYDMRQRGIQGRCVSSNNPGPNPNPNPYPPYPNPNPNPGQIDRYLRMSDYQLAQEAQYGIGSCRLIRGSYNSACEYYLQARGQGYPYGTTGCTDSRYTYNYGCNSYDQLQNSGCMIRRALQARVCL